MSDINSFLACRLQWQWGSVQNLMLLGTQETALAIGTGVHRALEAWYHPSFRYDYQAVVETSLEDLYARWYENELANGAEVWDVADVELTRGMLAGYQQHYGPLPTDDPNITQMLSTEQEFEVNIPGTRHALIGTMDGLFVGYDDTLWIVDHKTYSYAPTLTALQRNQQFLGYTWAANQLLASGALRERFGVLAHRVEGVLYNGIRKKLPTARTSAPFFKREWLRYSQHELAFFETHVRAVLAEMNRTDRVDYYAPGMHCDRCPFSDPCSSRQLGEDYLWTLEHAYVKRPPRGTVYTREEEDEDAS